jgi:hypothetical protein
MENGMKMEVPDGKRGIPAPLWTPSGSFPILRFGHFCFCRGKSNVMEKVIRPLSSKA